MFSKIEEKLVSEDGEKINLNEIKFRIKNHGCFEHLLAKKK